MTTIIIDRDLCTSCGICAKVCPVGLIPSPDEEQLPDIPEMDEPFCINCGHCEVFCPSQALTLNFAPGEKEILSPGMGVIPPGQLGYYLKNRRSIRHFSKRPVKRETIEAILDIVRYAPSGGNRQPVRWIVVHDPETVHRYAALTIDWMRHLSRTNDPLANRYNPAALVAAWERGNDVICRDAPHLLIAHAPAELGTPSVDAIIALTYADITAPSFGVGVCWAGFLSLAAMSWKPLQEAIDLPEGRTFSYALMFGYPDYQTYGIPRRNPVQVTWQ
jgi:nitroreductase/Pyruvate/2-oxoacid:ferredoxin oxidoreductase delta subunit